MVWAGVITGAHRSPLVFAEQRVKINSTKYTKFMEEEVLVWFMGLRASCVSMQTGAPSHTSKLTQARCKEHLHDLLDKAERPLSSPDINVMDFSL